MWPANVSFFGQGDSLVEVQSKMVRDLDSGFSIFLFSRSQPRQKCVQYLDIFGVYPKVGRAKEVQKLGSWIDMTDIALFGAMNSQDGEKRRANLYVKLYFCVFLFLVFKKGSHGPAGN